MKPTERDGLADVTRQVADNGGDPNKFVLGFALGRMVWRLKQILWVLGLIAAMIAAMGTIALVHFW
jgi:hypothetical protein